MQVVLAVAGTATQPLQGACPDLLSPHPSCQHRRLPCECWASPGLSLFIQSCGVTCGLEGSSSCRFSNTN